MAAPSADIPARREPPPFRRVEVLSTEARSPRLRRLTLGGPELEGFDPGLPAASVRLLVPESGEPTIPTWNGNEFLNADSSRPVIRTLTPLRFDPARQALDVEVVLHGAGPLATWGARTAVGEQAALSGTGRGYTVDARAPAYLLAGDESALPAIGQLLDALPRGADVQVLVEVGHPDARLELPRAAEWVDLPMDAPPGGALVSAVMATDLPVGTRVWAAGEAAAVQRIRKHLFADRGLDRSLCTIRGYWKHGRGG